MGGARGSGSFQGCGWSLLGRSMKVPLEQVLHSFLAEVLRGIFSWCSASVVLVHPGSSPKEKL